jgi:hypothetical protein
MPRPKRDVVGKTFGRLTVLRDDGHGKNPEIVCRCSCGKEVTLLKHNVLGGNTASCGCFRAESSGARRKAAALKVNEGDSVQDIEEDDPLSW